MNVGNGYTFVGNNPVSRLDPMGLAGKVTHGTKKCKMPINCPLWFKQADQWIKHADERIRELEEDKHNLKKKNPKSYQNHIDKAKEAIKNIRNCLNLIEKHCLKRPPAPVPVPVPVPVPEAKPDPIVTPENVGKAAVAVGAGYVIYRGIRMLPSLFPPLWPTIPANLACP